MLHADLHHRTPARTRTRRSRLARILSLAVAAVPALAVALPVQPALADTAGIDWTLQTSPSGTWQSVTYGTPGGTGLFVAVASFNGQVMSSPDGITWTYGNITGNTEQWRSVTYGNGSFVAVSSGGKVTTSTNGIDWTTPASAYSNFWTSVTYGNATFVAVSVTGTNNRVMTSSNGTSWTSQTSAADNAWQSVTFGTPGGIGTFVAVSNSGTDRVMTSTDGTLWTSRTAAANSSWRSVTYGNGTFVAVGDSGAVMTSTNGTSWTSSTAAANNSWTSVTYGDGLFVAVSSDGSNRVMTSPDGITWTARSSPNTQQWNSVTYGNGTFVAVAGNAVMTSSTSGQSASSDPADWTIHNQALPMPDSGSCSDITQEQNTFAAYGTDVTGGWVKGWEPWVDNGRGGWACRRTLINKGGNTWTIGT